MATRVEIEDIAATKSEKVLAVVLTTFLLMGSIWFYVKVDAWLPGGPDYTISAEEQRAHQQQDAAMKAEQGANIATEKARSDLTIAKDRFDIAAAQGVPTAHAQADYEAAEQNVRRTEKRQAQAQDRVEEVDRQLARFDRARREADHTGHDWAVAGVRLGIIATWLVVAFRITSRMRQRRSRFLPLGFAAIGAGVMTAVVYATDYITDYIDPLELGPIVLSGIGTLATMGAFVGLQEWLERRLPGKRVRSSECPFCGHPVRGVADGNPAPYCEGCGHQVSEPCVGCGHTRRVGSPHCPHCGHD